MSCLVVATTLASTLQAQSGGDGNRIRRLPRLGDHRFVLSTTLSDPFIATYARSMTGLGVAYGDIPIDTTGLGTATSAAGKSAFLVLGFEYQQAFGNRLAIWGNFAGGGRVGSSDQSALVEGVSVSTEFQVGVLVQTWRSRRVLVSGSFDIGRSVILEVTPAEFARSLIRNMGAVDQARKDLFDSRDPLTSRMGARIAVAPATWVGLSAMGEAGVVGLSNESREFSWATGVSASFDLLPSTGVPVGFATTYKNDQLSTFGEGSRRTSTVEVAIAFTGRDEFDIGLEGVWTEVPGLDQAKFDVLMARTRIRYFF